MSHLSAASMSHLPGYRIAPEWRRADPSLIAALGSIASPTIADAMNKFGSLTGEIHAIWDEAKFAGSAVPVLVRSGDNLMIHRAINTALPGDAIIINGQGSMQHALVGELMGLAALQVGVVGVVVDGAVRDVTALRKIGLPVFARGACGGGPVKDGPGELGYPIACGGVVCCAGDVVVADTDGVVIVPQADAPGVLALARAIERREEDRRQEIAAGHYRRSAVDATLRSAGIIEEGVE